MHTLSARDLSSLLAEAERLTEDLDPALLPQRSIAAVRRLVPADLKASAVLLQHRV